MAESFDLLNDAIGLAKVEAVSPLVEALWVEPIVEMSDFVVLWVVEHSLRHNVFLLGEILSVVLLRVVLYVVFLSVVLLGEVLCVVLLTVVLVRVVLRVVLLGVVFLGIVLGVVLLCVLVLDFSVCEVTVIRLDSCKN